MEETLKTTSTAWEFFQTINSQGWPAIETLIEQRHQETEWLDFKGCERINPESVKSCWSESICGFANTQGGVLIWGIDARRNEQDGIDGASGYSLAADARSFASRLVQLQPQSVEPPVSGVLVEPIVSNANEPGGCVVCFIPESDHKPHRAELSKGKPYMIRAADSFINPSPPLLKSLFFPKANIQLTISGRIAYPEKTDNYHKLPIAIDLNIKNTGHVSVRELFVIVSSNGNLPPGETHIPNSVKRIESTRGLGFEFKSALHPGSYLNFCTLGCEVPAARERSESIDIPRPNFETLELVVEVYSPDTAPQEFLIIFDELAIRFKRPVKGIPVPLRQESEA